MAKLPAKKVTKAPTKKQQETGPASKAAMARATAAGNKAYDKSPGKATSGTSTVWYEPGAMDRAFVNQASAMSKSLSKPAVKKKK